MRTTVSLDEQLVREVMSVTPAKTKTAAVARALQEHVRRRKLDKLRSLLGKIEIDEDEFWRLRELEKQETERIDE